MDVPRLDEVDGLKLQLAVDHFAQEMSGFYSVGSSQDDCSICSCRHFRCPVVFTVSLFSAAAIGSVGHDIGRHGAVITVVEPKERNTGNNTVPQMELTAHVARSHVTGMDDKHELFKGWRVPSLGITIVGER